MSANWFGDLAPGYLGSMFGPPANNGDDVVVEVLSIGDAVSATASLGTQTSETLSLAASQECQLDFYGLLEETLSVDVAEQATAQFGTSVTEDGLSVADSLDATISGTSVSDTLTAQDTTDATVVSAATSPVSIGGAGGGRSIYIESYRLKDGKVVPVEEEPLVIRLPAILLGGGRGKISLRATASGFRASREFRANLATVSLTVKKGVVSTAVVTASGAGRVKRKMSSRASSRITHLARGQISGKLHSDCRHTYGATASAGKAKFALSPSIASVGVGTFGRGQIKAHLSGRQPDTVHTVEFSDEQMALIAAMTEEMMAS